jgi:hypothetical protein
MATSTAVIGVWHTVNELRPRFDITANPAEQAAVGEGGGDCEQSSLFVSTEVGCVIFDSDNTTQFIVNGEQMLQLADLLKLTFAIEEIRSSRFTVAVPSGSDR